MLIRENLDKATLAIPVILKARLTVERQLVTRQIRGEQIGAISSLVLVGAAADQRTLRAKLVEGAQRFVRHYASKGYQALTEPEQFIVWGPYASRFTGVTDTVRAGGFAQGEDPFPESADFVIEGQFLATRGKVPEMARTRTAA